MIKTTLSLILLFVLSAINATAATYYVDGAAVDDTGDGSIGSPKKYINSGCLLLLASDTLIVADGVYDTSADIIENVASGVEGSHTIVMAENDFGVTLSPPYVQYHPPIHFRNKDYITVQGFIVNQDDTTDFAVSLGGETDRICTHINLIKIGAKHGMLVHSSTDILVEDSFAWGGHNYHMQSYRSYRVTWRRCVVRYDHLLDGEGHPIFASNVPQASFVAYNTEDAVYENCIALDGQTYSDIVPAGFQVTANNYTPYDSTRAKFLGSISLNQHSSPAAAPIAVNGFYIDVSQNATDSVFQNSISIDSSGYGYAVNNGDDATLNNLTSMLNSSGVIITASSSNPTLTNSLMMSNSGYGVYTGNSDYFAFYNNTLGISNSGTQTNYITTDPEILYPLRVETGSPIDGTGSGGEDRGANIINRYVDGTLTTALWPFPNEDIILSTIYDDEDTHRDWTASGKSLTRYIWEYLGNTCPVSICGAIASTGSIALTPGSTGVIGGGGTGVISIQ